MSLKDEMKEAKLKNLEEKAQEALQDEKGNLEVTAHQAQGKEWRDLEKAQGKNEFLLAAGQVFGAERSMKASAPWSKDDDEQLITYARDAQLPSDLYAKYPNRDSWEVLARLRHIVHERTEFSELKKKLR
jgi:hypothetical protein